MGEDAFFHVMELSDLDKDLLSWIVVYQPIPHFKDFEEFIKQSEWEKEQIVVALKRLVNASPPLINYHDPGSFKFLASNFTITKEGLSLLEKMFKEKNLPATTIKILKAGKKVVSFTNLYKKFFTGV